jgi:hypothetical protein
MILILYKCGIVDATKWCEFLLFFEDCRGEFHAGLLFFQSYTVKIELWVFSVSQTCVMAPWSAFSSCFDVWTGGCVMVPIYWKYSFLIKAFFESFIRWQQRISSATKIDDYLTQLWYLRCTVLIEELLGLIAIYMNIWKE